MFNWDEASLDACAWHIAKVPPQNTTSMLRYYERVGNKELVDKILKARIIAKRYRKIVIAERLTEEIIEESLKNATTTYSPSQNKRLDK